MSESEISEEFIEQLKSLDHRWRQYDLALKIEAELQNSEALKCVLHVLTDRAATALNELVDVDPTDHKKIMSLQARVQCARIMGETLESIRKTGAIAARTLQEDDRAGMSVNQEAGENINGRD